jgi:Rho-type GTPase-activating protein 1/2
MHRFFLTPIAEYKHEITYTDPAGNRWHIDCFRCNTCGTLLDSDANLLLLGDGSLICNNCTYSCSACGNKIEDLAILTGDQAFCASCFCCRNCKNKIENLRYARTTQGIFCMSCYESLTQKRRKNRNKQKQLAANTQKALPEPPKHDAAQSSFASGADTPSTEKQSDTEKMTDVSSKYSSSVRTLTNNSIKASTREMSASTLTEGKGTVIANKETSFYKIANLSL